MSWSGFSLRGAGVVAGALSLFVAAGAARAPEAHACGCFAPPDPSVPVVQAGELIVFGMEDGVVTAHIQIQYSGDAETFAWLVPLPSQPSLDLGTDELFTRILSRTQPRFSVDTAYPEECMRYPPPPPPAPPAPGEGSPLVEQDTIGPFEYAVLLADDKQAMLDWLADNGYFVPAGTDDAVDPYIRPGGYFLALKLQKGQSVGDLLPIVVKYPSELPQIPIVLTSVAADPDMPVFVWVLGESRAIPRNFFHTHINDALINWLDGGSNYTEVVTQAVDEAEGHHSFVTEYAGSSDRMRDVLDYPDRFGDLDTLRATTEPADYIQYLWDNGYAPGFLQISRQMVAILERHLPMPPALVDAVEQQEGRTLTSPDFYVLYGSYVADYPEILEDAHTDFDPVALTDEIEERIVVPTLAAGQMFRDHPYLTRLFTTLSPDEMTKDPVFSFNPDLPDVSNVHWAQLIYLECGASGYTDPDAPALLVTEQGRTLFLPNGRASYDWDQAPLPASLRIEVLREEGAAQVVTDNDALIDDEIDDFRPAPPEEQPPAAPGDGDGGGCAASPGAASGTGALLLLGLGAALLRRRQPRW